MSVYMYTYMYLYTYTYISNNDVSLSLRPLAADIPRFRGFSKSAICPSMTSVNPLLRLLLPTQGRTLICICICT